MVCDVVKATIATANPYSNQTELAQAVGTTYDVINNLANGRKRPDPKLLNDLRKVLRQERGWPYSDVDSIQKAKRGQLLSLAGTPLVQIPRYGSASAGRGATNVDVQDRTVAVPERLADIADVGYTIEGDSMEPFLRDGDTGGFKSYSRAKRGLIFLLKSPRSGFAVKLLTFDRGDWYAVSLNRKYPPRLLDDGEQVIGFLVGYYRVKGQRETMDSDPEGLTPEDLT